MSSSSTKLFNQTIESLIENMQNAWNHSDMEAISELLDENVLVFIEPVTVSKISIAPDKIEGKDNVIAYIKKLQKKLPLRYQAEYDKDGSTKNLKYRKYFYEIKAWASFDSTISEYGKFKEFRIGGYENVSAQKLTAFYILRNVVWFKLKSVFPKHN